MFYLKTITYVLLFSGLTACVSTKQPSPKVSEMASHEQFSRYGNPDSYFEKGEKYKVLTSAADYKEKGIASWYGPDFHKLRTSSGEKYDMYAMTAAHKTLPLPTYVRVRNLDNGREAVVKVNDRGPFHGERLIDLSYGAANQLGVISKGTANVEIEAIGSAPLAQYYLQAGAFESPEKAHALQSQLIASKLQTDVQVEKRDKHYIVSLGPLASQKQTEHFKSLLLKQGLSGVFSFLK